MRYESGLDVLFRKKYLDSGSPSCIGKFISVMHAKPLGSQKAKVDSSGAFNYFNPSSPASPLLRFEIF